MGWYGEPVSGGEGFAGLLVAVVVGLVLYGVFKQMRDARAMTLEDRELRRTQLSERESRQRAQPEELASEALRYERLTTQDPKWATLSPKYRLVSVEFVLELLRERIAEVESSIYWSKRKGKESERSLAQYRDDEWGLSGVPSRESLEHLRHEVDQSHSETSLYEALLAHRNSLLRQYERLARELREQV